MEAGRKEMKGRLVHYVISVHTVIKTNCKVLVTAARSRQSMITTTHQPGWYNEEEEAKLLTDDIFAKIERAKTKSLMPRIEKKRD